MSESSRLQARLDGVNMRLAVIVRDLDALSQFAALVMDGLAGQTLRNGADLVDAMVNAGLLSRDVVNGPCGPDCTCAEVAGGYPFECLKKTPVLERALLHAAVKQAELVQHLASVAFRG